MRLCNASPIEEESCLGWLVRPAFATQMHLHDIHTFAPRRGVGVASLCFFLSWLAGRKVLYQGGCRAFVITGVTTVQKCTYTLDVRPTSGLRQLNRKC